MNKKFAPRVSGNFMRLSIATIAAAGILGTAAVPVFAINVSDTSVQRPSEDRGYAIVAL